MSMGITSIESEGLSKYVASVDEDGASIIFGPGGFAQRIGHGKMAREKAVLATEILNGYVPGHFVILKSHRKLHIMGEDLDSITMAQKFSKTSCGSLVDLKRDEITPRRPGNFRMCTKCERVYRLMGGGDDPNQISFSLNTVHKEAEEVE